MPNGVYLSIQSIHLSWFNIVKVMGNDFINEIVSLNGVIHVVLICVCVCELKFVCVVFFNTIYK